MTTSKSNDLSFKVLLINVILISMASCSSKNFGEVIDISVVSNVRVKNEILIASPIPPELFMVTKFKNHSKNPRKIYLNSDRRKASKTHWFLMLNNNKKKDSIELFTIDKTGLEYKTLQKNEECMIILGIDGIGVINRSSHDSEMVDDYINILKKAESIIIINEKNRFQIPLKQLLVKRKIKKGLISEKAK